jgi:hypothetical protein
MPKSKTLPADDPTRPNVYRSTYLASEGILGDTNPDPAELAHREWLKRRLEEAGRFAASSPTKPKRRVKARFTARADSALPKRPHSKPAAGDTLAAPHH